ncbi:hypothetical protein DSO57_1001882 [Entomophthora muscae]|uniref:Uncharacterized protein n=1 Tax=Entomophthora muscae TaxID=34485 RepID=A0ACC2TK89_9FUNG|nr:hypothetical protein DSO57_1001882 [Entomophthora muscae]
MKIVKGLPQVQKVWQAFLQAKGYDSTVASNIRILSATEEGEVVCQFNVEKIHLNRLKGIHGGFVSTLVDIGGSLAIAAKGMFSTGVSTDISVSFLSKATLDDVVTMRSRCDKLGKSMAYTTTELLKRNPETQAEEIVAYGRHTKFVLLAHQSDAKIKSDV